MNNQHKLEKQKSNINLKGGLNPMAAAKAAGAPDAAAAAGAAGAAGALPPGMEGSAGADGPAPPKENTFVKNNPFKLMWSSVFQKSFDSIDKYIIKEPCLSNITKGTPPEIDDELPLLVFFKKSIYKFFNYKGLVNWNWDTSQPGRMGEKGYDFKSAAVSRFLKPKATLKLLFCFIKLALSPLYLFYIFFKYFLIFLKGLNLLNFFKAVAQVFLLIIGGILTLFFGSGLPLIHFSLNMPYDEYDEDGNLISREALRKPFASMLQYYAGMVIPLHFFDKKLGHNFGYGGLTGVGILIILISGVTIIYGGIAMGIILAVFIRYLYQVITGLKASATETSSTSTKK